MDDKKPEAGALKGMPADPTPEMIAAGVDALERWQAVTFDEMVVAEIYKAMAAVSQRPSHDGFAFRGPST
jgi:hypothetical protein